jgi:bifunctional ADP-heptose synthase (sugar kinase/adenylyltransferase)
MLTTELVERVLAAIPGRTVGVLGDLFLDRYLDIDPARDEPSVETGKVAYQVTRVRAYPGAAGTVINNLSALGVGRIYPIALIGDDGEGYELTQALKATRGVEWGGVQPCPGRRTPTYTKPMYGTEELNRLDIKNRVPTPDGGQDMILDLLDEAWPQFDALIVLDQVSEDECGVVTKRVRDRLAELAERDGDKFVLADSRERIGLFRNVCVKPNQREMCEAVNPGRWENDETAAEDKALEFAGHHSRRPVYCTLGANGIFIALPLVSLATGAGGRRVPTYPVSGPIDICGAGDSCSAGITSAMVSGLTHEQAAAFGNLVASITIQQIGVTGTATPEQVRQRWQDVSSV